MYMSKQCLMLLFITAGIRPKLSEAFKALLPLASQWENIGILLGISSTVLNTIHVDVHSAENCLREMLSYWLKDD